MKGDFDHNHSTSAVHCESESISPNCNKTNHSSKCRGIQKCETKNDPYSRLVSKLKFVRRPSIKMGSSRVTTTGRM